MDNKPRNRAASHQAIIAAFGALLLATIAQAGESPARWPADKANAWYAAQPWLVGFNYIPATAINTTEMWQADTFDPKTIETELTLARDLGFNSARVFLQYLVWEHDPQGFEKRLDQFLAIAAKHGIRTQLVLFDDCAFSTMTEPFLGKQPDVIPGEYANGWTPSPGPKRVQDRAAWPQLEAYVRAVVGRFREDPRVVSWDLYNEPSNSGMGNKSLPLLEAVFDWARQAGATQPLTVGVWGGTAETSRASLEKSDIISFHCYGNAAELERRIRQLKLHGRPILCTEWLNRPLGSLAETCLPVMARYRVGCFHWGLVNGKTQTHFPWGSKAGAPQPKVWQHDLFKKDHTPYDEKELAFFTDAIRKGPPPAATADGQWSAEKAWAWYSAQPWLVGCNFLPSTAVNDVEMWQAESFDEATIDRELGWAQDLGFNAVRVFVNYVVWEADSDGLKKRFDRFLAIADRHGIRVLTILLDDCFKPEPRVGKQEAPAPGVHNSQWVQSPGVKRRGDKAAWPKLEQYVKGMVGGFAADPRVLAWELYNEPTQSLPLVESAFRWAREARPSQPVTTTYYGDAAMRKRVAELSDVISFHNYGPLPGVQAEVAKLSEYGRPLLCTEWMARTLGSRFETHLPYFKVEKIACWNWGFVAGRTQTHFPWGSTPAPGATEPPLWFHDILRSDGSPFSRRELLTIRYLTGASKTPPPTPALLVPTAEKQPVVWRFTLEKPSDDWFKPTFDDSQWKAAPAPFGSTEPQIGRQPRTAWASADIWLRRELEMPSGDFNELAITIHHDEDTEVYVDGVLAAKLTGFNAAYASCPITPDAVALLKPGKHRLAVHCRQTGGGQFIDLGIEGFPRQTSTTSNSK